MRIATIIFIALIFNTIVVASDWRKPKITYETPPKFAPEDVLPPEFATSLYYSFEDKISVRGGMFHCTIITDIAKYECPSLSMLRIRAGEAEVLAKHYGRFSGGQVFAGFGSAITKRLTSVEALVIKPSTTYKTPKGLSRFGLTWASRLHLAPYSRSMQKKGALRNLVFGKARRAVATNLGLDVYTSNFEAQQLIGSLSRTRAAGEKLVSVGGMFLTGGASLALKGLDWHSTFYHTLLRADGNTLMRMNNDALKRMKTEKKARNAFLLNPYFTPKHQTAITLAIASMPKVENVDIVLENIADSDRELVSLSYQYMLELLALYNAHQRPLKKYLDTTVLCASEDVTGAVVVPVPLDYVAYTPRMARMLGEIRASLKDYKRVSLLINGVATTRFKKEADDLCIMVVERATSRLTHKASINTYSKKLKKKLATYRKKSTPSKSANWKTLENSQGKDWPKALPKQNKKVNAKEIGTGKTL